MPSLTDVKQQLAEWENSHATVFLSFGENSQFYLFLVGRIACGMDCGYFEIIATDDGRFSSPALSAFDVVFLGPDPNLGSHTTIRLRNSLFEITLTATTAPEEVQAALEAFIASEKPN